jgi:hypothetical protein
MNAMAGRTHFLVGLGWSGHPLPASFVIYGTADRASRGFGQLVLGFVGVMPIFLPPNLTVRPDGLETSESSFHFVLLGCCVEINARV